MTISIGGNDLLDLINDPMPVIMGTLQVALEVDLGHEEVFVLLPYGLGGAGLPIEAMIDLGLRGAVPGAGCGDVGLDDILACVTAATGGIVVDAYPLFAGRTLELTHMGEAFNVHPNDEGYEVIAKAHRAADRNS